MNLGDLFGKGEDKKIAEDMQNLSEQIAALKGQLSNKNSSIDELQQALADAQSNAGANALSADDAKQAINDLRSKLAVAQADKEAQDYQMQDMLKQVAQMQAQLAVAQAAAVSAAQQAPSAPAQAATLGGGLAVGNTAWVTRDGGMQLNVRSGPGLGYNVIAALDIGTSVTLLAGPQNADGHNWYQMRSERGVEGWVAGGFLRDHAV
jgi:uncharacterized protein YgiM (DUF1202 family)